MANLLIVDDNPANLRLLAEMLELHDFAVRSLRDGRMVVSAVRSAPPDLILLDIRMPGLDGYDVCQQLKADDGTRDIPVIFLNALNEVFDKVKAFAASGVDYITKPFQMEEVLARVRTHLSIRQLQQQFQEQNEALLEQKERLQRLSEASFEGILIYDQGHILEVNQALETMFGYQRAELLNRDLLDFVSSELRNSVQQHLQATNAPPNEFEGVKKDGARFPIEMQVRSMPCEGREIGIVAVRDLSWRKALEEEKQALLSASIPDRYKLGDMIGKSQAMQAVYQAILTAAASDANVVICGESGTGKELVARTIHQQGTRHDRPFVAVNCGAVPENLFEREFFGHRKGAFTGADRDRPGYFDRANGGTLFLDEIGELSPTLQVKLLRVLEEREYIPLGDTFSKKVDVRIVAATNRDLKEQVKQGQMREDFFYRIRVIVITVPPLRERREDIPLLIDHFLQVYGDERSCTTLPRQTTTALCSYQWPGNIREFQNEMQRYLAQQTLEFIGDMSPEPLESDGLSLDGLTFDDAVERLERRLLTRALSHHQGNTAKAAEMLGISIRTIQRKIRAYQLKPD